MKSLFFNALETEDLAVHASGYDREYDADDHAAFHRQLFTDGVLARDDPDSCRVYVNDDGDLALMPGAALAQGYMAIPEEGDTIPPENGVVVLRRDLHLEVRAFALAITEEPVQDDEIWDIPLARVTLLDTGEIHLEDLRELAGFSGEVAQIRRVPLLIPADSWREGRLEDKSGTYVYFADVEAEGLRDYFHVELVFDLDSLVTAADSLLAPVLEVMDDGFRLWSTHCPAADLTGEYVITVESSTFGGLGPLGTDIPVATRETLGGVVVSDGLEIDGAGNLSADIVPVEDYEIDMMMD